MNATDRRLAIIPKVLEACNKTLFDGILLTGSMVFGKYHSVNEASDIDMIFIVSPQDSMKLRQDPFLSQIDIHPDLIDALANKYIDRFWLDAEMDGIKVNVGIWSGPFIDQFVALQQKSHARGTFNPIEQSTHTVDPYGSEITYTPVKTPYGAIYIEEFLIIKGETFVGSPSYCNLVGSEVLYDPSGHWKDAMTKLTKNLNQRFGTVWVDNFLAYIINKSSPVYLERLRKNISNS